MTMDEHLAAIVRAAVADAIASADLRPRAEPEPLFDTAEIAKYLNVSTRTVQSLREQGGMPCRRVGDSWRYELAAVAAWTIEQARRGE